MLLAPVAGADLFRKAGLESAEDALTMLIMAGRRVSQETFGVICLPGGWADFARFMDKWQSIRSAVTRF